MRKHVTIRAMTFGKSSKSSPSQLTAVEVTPLILDILPGKTGKGILRNVAESFALKRLLPEQLSMPSKIVRPDLIDEEILKAIVDKRMPVIASENAQVLFEVKNILGGKYLGALYWIGGPSLLEQSGQSLDAHIRDKLLVTAAGTSSKRDNMMENGQVVFFGTRQDNVADHSMAVDRAGPTTISTYYEIDELRMFGIEETIDRLISHTMTLYPSGVWVHVSCDHVAIDVNMATHPDFVTLPELSQILERLMKTDHLLGISLSSTDANTNSPLGISVVAETIHLLFDKHKIRRKLISNEEFQDRQEQLRMARQKSLKPVKLQKNSKPKQSLLSHLFGHKQKD